MLITLWAISKALDAWDSWPNDNKNVNIDSQELSPRNNKIFVVYGHDEVGRKLLEGMLRRWGLEPLVLDSLPSENATIIEKLEKYTAMASFAVVLATPDDEGYEAGLPDGKKFRLRQNVVLELGMLLGKLGRMKVAVLMKAPHVIEKPSDMDGVIYIPYRSDVDKETRLQLAQEMVRQGFDIPVLKI